jgi:hypothetical protein
MGDEKALETLLARPEILTLFQNRNSEVHSRLLLPSSLKQLFIFLSTSDDRPILDIILRLFQSPNPSLLEAVFQSSELTHSLLSVLDVNSSFRTGYVTSIIETAVRLSPDDVLLLLAEDQIVFPTLLKRITEESIFTLFCTLITLAPSDSCLFLWGFLHAISPDSPISIPSALPPGVSACQAIELTLPAKVRLLEMFIHSSKTHKEENQFAKALSGLLPLFLSINAVKTFTLALELPPSEPLISHSLQLISTKSTSPRDLELALRYLAYGYDGSKIEPIINFLHRILRSSANNFVFQATSALISATFSKTTYPRFFAKVVQHCIARAWNRTARLRAKLLYRAAVLEMAIVVRDTPSWSGWEEFDRNVLEPFIRREEFSRNFLISEKNWDQELVDRIKTQPEVLERTIIDCKPSSGNLLAFLVSEPLTIDDPKEALEGEPAVQEYEDYDVLVIHRTERRRSRRRKTNADILDGEQPPITRHRRNTMQDQVAKDCAIA